MHFPVLAGADAILLLKGTEERRIIRETHGFCHGFHGSTLLNEALCGDEPPLGNGAIETDTQFFPECLGDRAFAYIKLVGNLTERQLFGQMQLHISQDLIKEFRFFRLQRCRAVIQTGSVQMGEDVTLYLTLDTNKVPVK